MTAVLPWIAVAGLGAVHGLSPTTGWMFAAAHGVRARDTKQIQRVLLPIAVGNVVSIAVVALVLAQGWTLDRALVQCVAGTLLVGAASLRLLRNEAPCAARVTPADNAGMALWSFLMATAHGAGMMLVPALVPLCLAGNPARAITASGSLTLGLAAVAVHTTAMLATTGIVAAGVSRMLVRHARLVAIDAPRTWAAVLAITGGVLIALR